MIDATVIIVGGGPAGAACARRLSRAGIDTIILDKKPFPRVKLCAGWITPNVLKHLDVSPDEYPHGILRFDRLVCHFWGHRITVRTRQYSIRRYEFDNWMLERAGVPVHHHTVRNISRENNHYLIDGKYKCSYLIGAGGTHCPVYQNLFRHLHPRPMDSLITAIEEEFQFQYSDNNCYLWFFDDGLPGYAWYVPKAGGYLNVGVGGKFLSMKKSKKNIKTHWLRFIKKLTARSLIPDRDFNPRGHNYYLYNRSKNLKNKNAFLVGDAAGLATIDMGEGIGPAIISGLKAAEAIIYNRPYTLPRFSRYSFLSILLPWLGY